MLQFCIFGGYEGPLGADKRFYLTLFGGCTLRRATVARQLIAAKQAGERHAPSTKLVLVTIFGSMEIVCPTLAEEFIDLREAVDGGALDMNQWDHYMGELDRWQSSSIISLTLFAGCSDSALPSTDDEIESLALQRHLGNISEDSGRILEMAVGQSGAQRRAIIHQAVHAA